MFQLNHVYLFPSKRHLTCVRCITSTEQTAKDGEVKDAISSKKWFLEGHGYTVMYLNGELVPELVTFDGQDVTKAYREDFSYPRDDGHGDPVGAPGVPGPVGFEWMKGWFCYTVDGRVAHIRDVLPDSNNAKVTVDGQRYIVFMDTGVSPNGLASIDMTRPCFEKLGAPDRPVHSTIRYAVGEFYVTSDNRAVQCKQCDGYAARVTDGKESWIIDCLNDQSTKAGYPSIVRHSIFNHTDLKDPLADVNSEHTAPSSTHADEYRRTGGTFPSTNIKTTTNKRQYTLIPQVALDQCADVFGFGARKYGANNWQKETNPDVYIDAALRHLAAICSGELIDPEHGQSHAAAVMTNAAILVWLYAHPKTPAGER